MLPPAPVRPGLERDRNAPDRRLLVLCFHGSHVAGLIGSPRMNFFVGRVSKGAEVTLAIDPAEAHLFSAKTTRSLRKGEPS